MSNIFTGVLKELLGAKNTIAGIEAQIKEKQTALLRLKKAPPPRSDVIAYFESLIEARAADYEIGLRFAIERLSGDPLRMEQTFGMRVMGLAQGGVLATDNHVENALLAMFGDDVKAAIKKRINALPWPGEPGPPVADRPALIATTEKELAALQEQFDKLRSEAAAAGIIL